MVTKKQFIRRWEMRLAEEAKCPPHMKAEFLGWLRTTVYYRRALWALEFRFFWLELSMKIAGTFRKK